MVYLFPAHAASAQRIVGTAPSFFAQFASLSGRQPKSLFLASFEESTLRFSSLFQCGSYSHDDLMHRSKHAQCSFDDLESLNL